VISPLRALNYLIDSFESDIVTMDYRVRGFTRDVKGRKHYIDHKINSIQDYLAKNVGARYEMPVAGGTGAAQLDYSYRGSLPLTPINNQALVPDAVERDMNRALGILNGRLEYKREDLGLTGSVWVTNLTDEKYGYEGISAGFTAGISHLVVQAPRMWGVTVRKTFGGE